VPQTCSPKSLTQNRFPVPDKDALLARYEKIRNVPIEQAAEFPPDMIALRKFSSAELDEHVRILCHHLPKQREDILRRSAIYLVAEHKAGTYSAEEVTVILNMIVRYNINSKGEARRIRSDNEHLPHEVTGSLAAKMVERMRQGTPAKDSLRHAVTAPKTGGSDLTRNGWETYPQSKKIGDAKKLRMDLATTNWCTGGDLNTAQTHLKNGPFYVFFLDGEPTIAIRTQHNDVAEIRGRGPEQSIPTDELRQTAEDFITKGTGPKRGDDYLWDQSVRKACVAFMQTGKIGNILKLGFNQHGRWNNRLTPKMGNYSPNGFEEEYVGSLRKIRIPKHELEETLADGTRILLCHFESKSKKPIRIDYHRILGHIFCPNTVEFVAPNLTQASRQITLIRAKRVVIPNLTQISPEASLNLLAATELVAPHLKPAENILAHKVPQFTKTNKLGEKTLLCSICAFEGDGEIDFHHIRGHIHIGNRHKNKTPITQFTNLETAGSDVIFMSSLEIQLPNLRKIAGRLTIRKAKKLGMPSLETCGTIKLKKVKELRMPKLKKVKWIDAKECTRFEAPQLEEIEKLLLGKLIELKIPKVKKMNSIITSGRKINTQNIEILTGELGAANAHTIKAHHLRKVKELKGGGCKTLIAPNLERVGKWHIPLDPKATAPNLKITHKLHVSADPEHMPNSLIKEKNGEKTLLCSLVMGHQFKPKSPNMSIDLHHIIGDLEIWNSGHFEAPNLKSVTGTIKLGCNTNSFPELQHLGGIIMYSAAPINAPKCKSVNPTLT
jgi:hypothetical protein